MVRASALYISLIISLLIVLVCGAMLMTTYIYRMQDRKAVRMQLLKRNLSSARELLLLDSFPSDTLEKLSLFGEQQDSVLLEKRTWGVYQTGIIRAWVGADSVAQAIMMGTVPADTLQVFYLADEDRPVSISGKSKITGTAYLPKSGIKAAYVEGRGYEDRTLVYGSIKDSGRELELPAGRDFSDLADWMQEMLRRARQEGKPGINPDVSCSFLEPVKWVYQGAVARVGEGQQLSGQVILAADSAITVQAGARLEHAILIAPYIRIEEGFTGRLQALATDSIVTGAQVQLKYPSALVVLKPDTAGFQARLSMGKDCLVEGPLIAWEKQRSELMPLLQIGEGTLVKGELWSKGYVTLAKNAAVNGSVTAIRLMARVSGAIYENYLIDVKLDRTRLSRYYLSTGFLNGGALKQKILCRLN
ncbi:hypothetical protein [Pedobacter sp. JY14-1]|uniref:hypothetical protein n=1 Tax=Pedobacter sp. JY14-1 TaxID=3034151 RepID=UPI0023E27555|nr:hypothetical protein [Pedobacter sp. JY14-1]